MRCISAFWLTSALAVAALAVLPATFLVPSAQAQEIRVTNDEALIRTIEKLDPQGAQDMHKAFDRIDKSKGTEKQKDDAKIKYLENKEKKLVEVATVLHKSPFTTPADLENIARIAILYGWMGTLRKTDEYEDTFNLRKGIFMDAETIRLIGESFDEITAERRKALANPGDGIAPEHSSAGQPDVPLASSGGCNGVDSFCIEASLGPQWLNHDNLIGMGTVVTPDGEPFLFGMPGTLSGFGGGVRVAVGNPDLPVQPFLELHYASFSGDADGFTEIGPDVQGVGLTFFEFDPLFGTGVGDSDPGLGLRGAGSIDANLFSGDIGVKLPSLTEFSAFDVTFRGGVRVAVTDLDADGRTDLLFDGQPLPGFFQNFDYSARDTYVGFVPGVDVTTRVADRVQLFLGADVFLAYHKAEGSFFQETGVGTGVVVQAADLDEDGFALGGRLTVGGKYQFSKNGFFTVNYSLDVIPEATTIHMPRNPNEQPGQFSSDTFFAQGINFGLEFRY